MPKLQLFQSTFKSKIAVEKSIVVEIASKVFNNSDQSKSYKQLIFFNSITIYCKKYVYKNLTLR